MPEEPLTEREHAIQAVIRTYVETASRPQPWCARFPLGISPATVATP